MVADHVWKMGQDFGMLTFSSIDVLLQLGLGDPVQPSGPRAPTPLRLGARGQHRNLCACDRMQPLVRQGSGTAKKAQP